MVLVKVNKANATTDSGIATSSQEAVESIEALYLALQLRFPRAIHNFESRWSSWHEECLESGSPERPDTWTRAAYFGILRGLGPKIIPFIVHKLVTDPEKNYHGVLLYVNLESDPAYSVTPKDLITKESLLLCCGEIVELNYKRNKIVDRHIAEFIEHHDMNHARSNSSMFTECDPYRALLGLGPSIIANIMVAYFNFSDGYWYELLHQINHGRKMGAHMVWRRENFFDYLDYFNEKDHEGAMHYFPTEEDRLLRAPAGNIDEEAELEHHQRFNA